MVEEATAARDSQTGPRHRVVLLGASNLARGIATAVSTARSTCGGPLDLLVALGHGRSYGRGSCVLGRWLPGIVGCQLWRDLQERAALPTSAVLTDVGNDILFGASPTQIADWVRECVRRMHFYESRIVLTGVPLTSLARMSGWEYTVFRSILFPTSRLRMDEALDRAANLDAALRAIAAEEDCEFVEPLADWYVRDRIHISRARQRQAWQAMMTPLRTVAQHEARPAQWTEFIRIRTLTPCHRKVFGVSQRAVQPAGKLRDGTRISLY